MTAETTRSERLRGGSGDNGGVLRGLRRRAANDSKGNMQQTTAKATCSKQCRGSSGKDGGVRRGVRRRAGGSVRWRKRSSDLVRALCDDGERARGQSIVFASSAANCRRHEMLKP